MPVHTSHAIDLIGRLVDRTHIHERLFYLWTAAALALSVNTAWLGYVGGVQPSDVTHNWESCLFEPNYAVLSHESANDALDKKIDLGSFVHSLIYVCTGTLVLTFLGQIATLQSLKFQGWALPAVLFGVWCSMLSVTYYTASPPLPIPSETSATLVLFFYWLNRSAFIDVNNGENDCGTAYSFVSYTLALNVFLVLMQVISTTILFYFEHLRLSDPMRVSPTPVVGSQAVYGLTCLMACCYVGQFLGRVISSINSLQCLQNSHSAEVVDDTDEEGGIVHYPDLYFPFQPGYINITSICWVVVLVSSVRVYFQCDAASLRYIAGASFLFFLTNASSMFYVMAQYYDLNLDKDTVCFDYFRDTSRAAIYGYPTEYQSMIYCQGTRITTFCALALYISMTGACVMSMALYANYSRSRQSTSMSDSQLPGVSALDSFGEYLLHADTDGNYDLAHSPNIRSSLNGSGTYSTRYA